MKQPVLAGDPIRGPLPRGIRSLPLAMVCHAEKLADSAWHFGGVVDPRGRAFSLVEESRQLKPGFCLILGRAPRRSRLLDGLCL